MIRLNKVVVNGKYEGFFLIDRDVFTVYDDIGTDKNGNTIYGSINEKETESMFNYIMWDFGCNYRKRFPSFRGVFDEQTRHCLDGKTVHFENELFYIATENNDWSVAIELIQKHPDDHECYKGLQNSHFQKYLDEMKNCLLACVSEIYESVKTVRVTSGD